MGYSIPGTRIRKTVAARGAEFLESKPRSCSQRRDVVDFMPAYVNMVNLIYKADIQPSSADDSRVRGFCNHGPDFNNAVSTLVVRALPGGGVEHRPKYYARSVRVITLAEVFNHYKDEAEFSSIYDVWLEGAVVIRNAPKRGQKRGKK